MAQRQPHLPVEAIDPLAVAFSAFSSQQHMHPPVTVMHPRCRDFLDMQNQRPGIPRVRSIAIDRALPLHHPARLALAGTVAAHQKIHEAPATKRLQRFLTSTSWSMALSMISDQALELDVLFLQLLEPAQLGRAQPALLLAPGVDVASAMPIVRQAASTGVTSSACLSAKAICSSVNFDRFMAQRLFTHRENCAENSSSKRYEITVQPQLPMSAAGRIEA